jgi:uncharacterized protein YjbI with pentapeptide repeats
MANPEHIEELKKGVESWNAWRKENPDIEPDLSSTDLSETNLKRVNFQRANLSKTKLNNSDLTRALLNPANLVETNLSYTTLDGAFLNKANLSKACLTEANLYKTNINEANLSGANLSYANLSNAFLNHSDLTEANLQNAILRKAKLENTSISGTKFGGSDVTNATFSSEINFEKNLEIFNEASRIARKHFAWLISGLAFSLLTIFSTNDVSLLTNSPTNPLPIIQTPIPLAGFYWVAPFLLVSLYFYFHIQLQHNWRIVSRLPAIFPDGVPIDQKLFPWQLNMWCRNFFPLINADKKLHAKPRDFLIVFLTWWSTPVVLLLFWFRYLPRHDQGTWFHISLFIITSFSALGFYGWAKKIFPSNLTGGNKDLLTRGILIIFIFSLFAIMSSRLEKQPFRNADFTGKDVSFKPDNWDPKDPTQGVKGVTFGNTDLRFVMASSAFLAKANFDKTNLRKAILINTNLQNANFNQVKFTEAKLDGAILKNAKFHESNLSRASLIWANFENATLNGVNLTGVNLTEANFTNALLGYIEYSNDLLDYGEYLESSRKNNLQRGKLIITNLKGANLSRTNFQKAKLFKVNLSNSKFKKTNLKATTFEDVKNLTCAQLQSSYIDKKTKVPSYLKILGGVMGKVKFWNNEIDVLKNYQCQEIKPIKSK